MKFKLFNDWSDLDKYEESLFIEAEKQSVFFSKEWLESLTPQLVKQEQQLLLACVIDQHCIVALLPILSHENREWSSLSHPYSSLFRLLLAPEDQTHIIDCLCQGLAKLEFDYLSLAPVDIEDNYCLLFQQGLKKAGLKHYQHHKAYNWFYTIKAKQNYADYLAARPSQVRNTVLRKQRKLAREQNYEIKLYVNDDIEAALADYHDIYKVSWKANEQYQTLVNDVVKRFAKRAWPRLAIMSIKGKPIAAQLWFVAGEKASIFRLVYDEAWKEYSPGSILMSYLLEHVIDVDKVKEIDFLSGNDSYKKDWMSERRERSSFVIIKETNIQDETTLFERVIQRWFNFCHGIHGQTRK